MGLTQVRSSRVLQGQLTIADRFEWQRRGRFYGRRVSTIGPRSFAGLHRLALSNSMRSRLIQDWEMPPTFGRIDSRSLSK